MNALKERIRTDARNLGGGILKVTAFVNHQVDAILMDQCGRDLASRFATHGATRVLTAESSGIAPALATAIHLKLPMIFARKVRPVTLPDRVLHTTVRSHTRGRTLDLIVSSDYLQPADRVLIIDDFLACGDTVLALAELVRQADASLVGIGVLIEKSFEEGRVACAGLGVPVEALATVADMSDGKIVLA